MTEQYILYVIDTETTGLDHELNEIVELSASRFSFNNSDFKTDQKTWCIRALHPETIQDDALKINGHLKEDILHLTQAGKEKYLEPADVIADIEDWISEDGMLANDRVFAGQNPMFDFNMMISLWKSQNVIDTFPFIIGHNAKVVDSKMLALILDICMNRKREKYNLGALVKAFKVKKGKAHRADEDVRMTVDLFTAMFKAIANDTTKELLKETE